ncbi:hypothetical protein B296_00040464 [Ensete ventricosum]|uniref:CCHC-type domain-containing protein n=1 Tax=Ensete ventricosum TaxID=4639 RepID=A0A426XNA1_ENSVE|nr:hypothetical protein B296_00040464 [Ensete ventricosum]
MTDDEIRKSKRFERGLRLAIRSRISVLKLPSYADVVENALIIERDLEEIQEIRGKNKDQFITKSKQENEYEDSNKRVKISRFRKEKSPRRTHSYAKYGFNHETRQYYWVTRDCFAYGKLDHKIKDCPLKKKEEPRPPRLIAQARVYAISEQDSQASKLVVKGIIHFRRVILLV